VLPVTLQNFAVEGTTFNDTVEPAGVANPAWVANTFAVLPAVRDNTVLAEPDPKEETFVTLNFGAENEMSEIVTRLAGNIID
jgi:hypothetical protein